MTLKDIDLKLPTSHFLRIHRSYIVNVSQVEEVANLFVFGSPDAQRAGQQLSGAAAVLAARYSSGPIRMSSSEEWVIDSVTAPAAGICVTRRHASGIE